MYKFKWIYKLKAEDRTESRSVRRNESLIELQKPGTKTINYKL